MKEPEYTEKELRLFALIDKLRAAQELLVDVEVENSYLGLEDCELQ